MESQDKTPQDSPAPDSKSATPAPAVPTNETTPLWARTVPVAPPLTGDEAEATPEVTDTQEAELLPALPMQKPAPDWAHSEPPAPAIDENEPRPAVPMQKPAPVWAQTVPAAGEEGEEAPAPAPVDLAPATAPPAPAEPIASPEAAEPIVAAGPTEPPAAVTLPIATKPPPVAVSEEPVPPPEPVEPPEPVLPPQPTEPLVTAMASAPPAAIAPQQEKADDIWPEEPPTEPAMPAWPPSSELSQAAPRPSDILDEAIPSWPPDFDSAPGGSPTVQAGTPAPGAADDDEAEFSPSLGQQATPPSLPVKSTTPQPRPQPFAEPRTVTPAQPPAPAAAAAFTPAPVPAQPRPEPPVVTPPPAPAPAEPVQPAQASPPWVPTPPAGASSGFDVDWPSPVEVPSWAPRIRIGSVQPEPAAGPVEAPAPHPTPAASTPPATTAAPAGARPTSSTPPAPPAPQASATASKPPPPPTGAPATAGGGKDSKSAWEVVQQKPNIDPAKAMPTAEDRSYAEWFAWAKRGGAPASACHAAAQGAFMALAGGHDVAVAVQWATAAMSRPPAPVSQGRQAYCAWFSLANIDMNLDQHRAHAFAAAAIHALEAGADSNTAHAAGLAAAGIH